MTDHEKILYEVKCSVFDLLSNLNEDSSLEDMLTAFKEVFMEHFEIGEAEILLYDNNRFVPLFKNGTAQKDSGSERETYTKDHPIFNVSFISHVADREYEFADDSLIIRDVQLAPLAALLFKASEKWHAFALSSHLKDLKKVFGIYIGQVVQMYQLSEKERTYRHLFEVAELFNSTMEIDVILEGLIDAVSGSFPNFHVDLLLSNEQKGKTKEYRLFDYANERASAIDAFLSGDLTIENASDISSCLMNAPIRGRQGIYGVLQMTAPKNTEFTITEKSFIRSIANAAGSALENASLYDQSHRLVDDLRLVNEASRKLNSNLDLDEMIGFLKKQFLNAFRPNEMAFVFLDDESGYSVSPSSTSFFTTGEGEKYIQTASARLRNGEDAIFDANSKSCTDETERFKSLVSIPINNGGEMIGFVILVHREEYFFSFDSFKLMRSLIGHSSLAISNIMLRDQLQELVDKDHLTKLFTRSYLDDVVNSTMENEESGVFLLMDVDDFKLVNDSYGHTTGDTVLQQISSFIMSIVEGWGIASRWGGEEIAIFVPSATIEDGIDLARQLVEGVPEATDPHVTVSIGLSAWSPDDGKSYKELFQATDRALYHAKNYGKNRFVLHGAASAIK
ncbi:sensor domain-containing diguanylate cyclase [Sporosarcina sp. ACRSL]|uniref:sensor domain-containing diguanylate cyclase n=1 Tax=Sporosarcina sp. ACRSL TaxID=2918215 RepID=UPI001EF6C300|nr:sensor domain-containing diguanylate cyclase [Sporosarcina sp. ACRSL]MCG7344416.1 sensor domain-containing diguanylate cyclase [Sporosarcina sp. ACRSL]